MIKSPKTNVSKPVPKKSLIASIGEHTIGSPWSLKLVLRIIGKPVNFLNSSIKS
jgi:hypothetical protein